MNPQYKLTMIAALTGAALTLAVSLILYFLAQSRQRKQWTLDTKKVEWKELIGTLCQSARCMLDNSPDIGHANAINVRTGEQERKSYEADSEARKAIQDRIFISNPVQREKILERWQLVTAEKDGSRFWNGWNDLHETLIKAAHKDLGLKK